VSAFPVAYREFAPQVRERFLPTAAKPFDDGCQRLVRLRKFTRRVVVAVAGIRRCDRRVCIFGGLGWVVVCQYAVASLSIAR
jgi:hypothetical protein